MPTMSRVLSTAPLKDIYQKELLQILGSHEGPKAIYWQREAIAPVNLIVGHSLLKVSLCSHIYTFRCIFDISRYYF